MKVYSEILNTYLLYTSTPQRIVCFNSSFTEILFNLGFGDLVVGVSPYCSRYCECQHLPYAGDYLQGDIRTLKDLNPDLILMTGGVQLPLAKKLANQGLPVYTLPLPVSIGGVGETIIKLGGLLGDPQTARRVTEKMFQELWDIRRRSSDSHRTIYAEPWFGKHPRRIGALSFMHDILWFAGTQPLYGNESWSYELLDLEDTGNKKPQIFLGFHEPEFPVNFTNMAIERGWTRDFNPQIIVSDTRKGRNIIHDGPSLVDTVRWLQEAIG